MRFIFACILSTLFSLAVALVFVRNFTDPYYGSLALAALAAFSWLGVALLLMDKTAEREKSWHK